ncbi:MAG: hypothetical protein RIK87_06200 [Fuerstiella sp.]
MLREPAGLPARPDYVAGSFRDRAGRVFEHDGEIFRAISEQAREEWEFAASLEFVRNGMQRHEIVPTKYSRQHAAAAAISDEWTAVLHHERLPLVTYPYEWSFSMLRDAALLHLDLIQRALSEDAIFKDATPFNIQFDGVRPVFIDTASIVRLRPGALWEGYRQFCQMFLYPLMLQSFRGVDFQPFLRGRLDGISPEQFHALTSFRDKFRRGVLTHVVLHSRLQPASQHSGAERISESLKESGFRKSLIENNIAGLTRLIRGLSWTPSKSRWSDYDREAEPVRLDAQVKENFVREVTAPRHWKQVWDVGCNLGRYSRIAAASADLVVALDSDHLTVDRLYRSLRDEGVRGITPLVYNPADPSPGLGWRCTERAEFADRGRPDLILFLAVLHHLVIGCNLLLPDVIDWLAERRAALVIEFVDRRDPQVQSLLANRDDVFPDYSREAFERCLRRRFTVRRTVDLPSGARTLFHVTPSA